MNDLENAIEKMNKALIKLENCYLIFKNSKNIANDNEKLEIELKRMKHNNAAVKEKIDNSIKIINFIIKDSENGWSRCNDQF